MWIHALWKSTLLLSLTLSHEFSKLKPITGIFWEEKAHYSDSPLFILLSFSVTITTEPPPLPQVNLMSDLHDLTFTYCHTVMSGTNEHTMNMSKGWGTNSESLGGSTEPFKEVHEIKTIFLIILFQSIDTCTDCAKEMVAKTTDTLVQIKTAVAPNKLVAIIPSLLYSQRKRGGGSQLWFSVLEEALKTDFITTLSLGTHLFNILYDEMGSAGSTARWRCRMPGFQKGVEIATLHGTQFLLERLTDRLWLLSRHFL